MTFDEAVRWPPLGTAAYKVWQRFQYIPGFYLAVEDLKQIGAMTAWNLGARLETIDEALLYTIIHRDIYDQARESIDFSRCLLKDNDFPVVYPLEPWLAAGNHLRDSRGTAYDALLGKELVGLVDDKRCKLTPKETITARLYFLEDVTQSEIAARTGFSRSMISVQIDRVTTKMRARLSAPLRPEDTRNRATLA